MFFLLIDLMRIQKFKFLFKSNSMLPSLRSKPQPVTDRDGYSVYMLPWKYGRDVALKSPYMAGTASKDNRMGLL